MLGAPKKPPDAKAPGGHFYVTVLTGSFHYNYLIGVVVEPDFIYFDVPDPVVAGLNKKDGRPDVVGSGFFGIAAPPGVYSR